MSVRSLILPLLAVLWLWPITAYGQSPALDEAYKRAGELYAQGHYQEALPFAEEALRLSEREFGPDHSGVATALMRLALVYSAQGKYAEAMPPRILRRILREKVESFLPPNALHVAKVSEASEQKTLLELAGTA